MKIRWTNGSLRYRITPTELQNLVDGKPSQATLDIPGTVWEARLEKSEDLTNIHSLGCTVSIMLSSQDIQELASPETEGVYFKNELGFMYFVEKDFPCAHPRAIDEALGITETFTPTLSYEERKKTGG
jgi:hypothetical protein